MDWKQDYWLLRQTCFQMTRFCFECGNEWIRIEKSDPHNPKYPKYIFHCVNSDANKKKKSTCCNRAYEF